MYLATLILDFDMQKYRLGDRSQQFLDATQPSTELINQVNEFNASQKRSNPNAGYANGANKKQKVRNTMFFHLVGL